MALVGLQSQEVGQWQPVPGDGIFLAARIWGEGSVIHSKPTLFFFFFLSGDQLAHTNSTLYARIGPQWLSKLR